MRWTPVIEVTMTSERFDVLEKSDKNVDAIATELRGRVQAAAFPFRPGDKVALMISRAAFRLGLPVRRVKSLWYGAARRIDAWEAEHIRSRTAHIAHVEQVLNELQQQIEAARRVDAQLAFDFGGGPSRPARHRPHAAQE
jgi:hypothetical protein